MNEQDNSDKRFKSIAPQITALLDNNKYNEAFNLVNDNISLFCSNIESLQDYSLKIGAKCDNSEKALKM